MLSKQAVEDQLNKIGFNVHGWGRSEINELNKILMEDEVIAECVNGEYDNGFALLAATNHRVLLVDKKPLLYLTVEDLRFDMISDFNFNQRFLNATICISAASKTLSFKSWNKRRLRKLMQCVQSRVIELRQHQHLAQQFQAEAMEHLTALRQGYEQSRQPSYVTNTATAQASAIQQNVSRPNTAASNGTSRFATRRSALGTYTRSKLPSLHHHSTRREAEVGEIYPAGYTSNANGALGDYRLPYEFEG